MVKNYSVYFSSLAFFIIIVVALITANPVIALTANFSLAGNPNAYVNLAGNTTFNVSIGTTDQNISNVSITYLTQNNEFSGYFFNIGSNSTSAAGANFFNSTAGSPTATVNLTFYSTTTLIRNGTTQSFLFSIKAPRFDAPSLVTVNVTAVNSTGGGNSNTLTLNPAFSFSGYVVNETGCTTYYNSSGCWQNGTNVSIIGVTAGAGGGPPTNTILASALTNSTGYFKLSNINASAGFMGFTLQTTFYNASNIATKVGSTMPAFPSFMYYGGGGEGEFDMSLNNGVFYLQPAVTINISANNGTNSVSFGYEIIDQALGFPIESNIQTKVYNASIVVSANRAYVVNLMRMFSFPGASFGYQSDASGCAVGDYMNDTHCPAPPKSQSITAAQAVAGSIINVNLNLSIRKAFVHGCVNPASGANNSDVNITAISVKILPWTTSAGSFIPPGNANDGSVSISNINFTYPGCVGYYNFSLLSGTGYMLEFYAKNASVEANNPTSGTNSLAGFQNLTATDGLQKNVTMHKLAGVYYNTSVGGVSYNTSLMKINIINSSGGLVTSSVNANIKIKNSGAGIGTVFYIITQVTNGTFYMPILNNSNFAKVMVFSQNGPPRETSINISASEANITIISMDQDKGFRKFHSNGSIETINTATLPITMRFLSTGAGCDVPNAPDTCIITSMNATSFNPMKAMLAGKVNMEIKITSTNVSLVFHDYDMLSAKQPPMQSTLDQNASEKTTSSSSSESKWSFGSFAPVNSYSNVTIVMPYSDTSSDSNYINDSASISTSLPLLYDDNQKAIWNKSKGDGTANLTDDFLEYNASYYSDYLTSSGVSCGNSSYNRTCFANTSSNYIALTIPHFSTIGVSVIGAGTGSSTSSGAGTTAGGGGSATTIWRNTYVKDDTELKDMPPINLALSASERIRVKINSETHYIGIALLTNNSATVEVSSAPQQAIMKVGDIKRFDVTNDSYYDIKVNLLSIENNKANITAEYIHEKVEELPVQQGNKSEGQETQKTEKESIAKNIWLWIIIIIIVVMILLIVKYWNKKYSERHK